MNIKISIITVLLLTATIIYSQKVEAGYIPSPVYKIPSVYSPDVPFASKGNSIELTVANTSTIKAEDVEVRVINKPEWIKFEDETKKIDEIKGGKEKAVTFIFSVEKMEHPADRRTAPVKQTTNLKFKITNKKGESWGKEISIAVSAPKEFKLYQNYPNPFNPSTTISYTIPNVETGYLTTVRQVIPSVQIKIYDILGREVATLVNKEQQAGFYKINWSAGGGANNYASGMYIYRIIAKYKNGDIKIQQKKMMLMK